MACSVLPCAIALMSEEEHKSTALALLCTDTSCDLVSFLSVGVENKFVCLAITSHFLHLQSLK